MGSNNRAFIVGAVTTKPLLHHMSGNEMFYSMNVKAKRKSGVEDTVVVVYGAENDTFRHMEVGDRIQAFGEYRSHNNHSKTALVKKEMFLYATENIIFIDQEQDEDYVEFNGSICNEPIFRETPLHKEICDFVIAVLRDDGKYDYINCITWGRLAREVGLMYVGDKLTMKGRMQSREYIKKHDGIEETRTAYEVSAFNVKKVEVE